MPVVAYCRGPFCLMAKDAVELLRKRGYRAFHLSDGVADGAPTVCRSRIHQE